MLIEVRVSTNCPTASVKEVSPSVFKVRVKAKPLEGKANAEIVELLAGHFKVGKNLVKIIRGAASKKKIVEIELKK